MRAAVGLSFLMGYVGLSAGQETERFRGPDPFCQDECIDGELCAVDGFGSGGPQYTCKNTNECNLKYDVGTQPWTDYAALEGRRMLQDTGQETGGGGTGTSEVVSICDRLTACEDLDPSSPCGKDGRIIGPAGWAAAYGYHCAGGQRCDGQFTNANTLSLSQYSYVLALGTPFAREDDAKFTITADGGELFMGVILLTTWDGASEWAGDNLLNLGGMKSIFGSDSTYKAVARGNLHTGPVTITWDPSTKTVTSSVDGSYDCSGIDFVAIVPFALATYGESYGNGAGTLTIAGFSKLFIQGFQFDVAGQNEVVADGIFGFSPATGATNAAGVTLLVVNPATADCGLSPARYKCTPCPEGMNGDGETGCGVAAECLPGQTCYPDQCTLLDLFTLVDQVQARCCTDDVGACYGQLALPASDGSLEEGDKCAPHCKRVFLSFYELCGDFINANGMDIPVEMGEISGTLEGFYDTCMLPPPPPPGDICIKEIDEDVPQEMTKIPRMFSPCLCPGDTNQDFEVDTRDVLNTLRAFALEDCSLRTDFTGDCAVGVYDLLHVLKHFGRDCTCPALTNQRDCSAELTAGCSWSDFNDQCTDCSFNPLRLNRNGDPRFVDAGAIDAPGMIGPRPAGLSYSWGWGKSLWDGRQIEYDSKIKGIRFRCEHAYANSDPRYINLGAVVGFTAGSGADLGWNQLDFGFYCSVYVPDTTDTYPLQGVDRNSGELYGRVPRNTLNCFESGGHKCGAQLYGENDLLELSWERGEMEYKKNGDIMYTSSKPIQFPIRFAIAFWGFKEIYDIEYISSP